MAIRHARRSSESGGLLLAPDNLRAPSAWRSIEDMLCAFQWDHPGLCAQARRVLQDFVELPIEHLTPAKLERGVFSFLRNFNKTTRQGYVHAYMQLHDWAKLQGVRIPPMLDPLRSSLDNLRQSAPTTISREAQEVAEALLGRGFTFAQMVCLQWEDIDYNGNPYEPVDFIVPRGGQSMLRVPLHSDLGGKLHDLQQQAAEVSGAPEGAVIPWRPGSQDGPTAAQLRAQVSWSHTRRGKAPPLEGNKVRDLIASFVPWLHMSYPKNTADTYASFVRTLFRGHEELPISDWTAERAPESYQQILLKRSRGVQNGVRSAYNCLRHWANKEHKISLPQLPARSETSAKLGGAGDW